MSACDATDVSSSSTDRSADGADLRVVLVENDALVRQPLRYLLGQAMPDLRIVETLFGGLGAVQYCLRRPQSADVLLTDMHLGDVDGPAVAWRLRHAGSLTPILGITSLPLSHYRNAAVAAGMQGLLPKSNIAQIASALRNLRQGRPCPGYESPMMAAARIRSSKSPMSVLTNAQTNVLELIAAGYDLDEIARRLHCSPATVRKHRQNIFNRLNVSTIQEAIAQWTRFRQTFNLD
ncbi:MAG: response regulator transcription factor [Bifidobacterium castoris]|nr:response regulator transcription factor [Bifidobacterium castoris]